ncbi:YdbC family protein [Rummeliibacillus sp. NPDC094406]|uniref:YdbC family protein n=1 Tax=Rummeliibacillus sp. NPDC094406 TaxID=3364511 RepID=UPI003809E759
MIIKSIFCKVNEGMKLEFSQHQLEWQTIHKADGFLGQIGGWSLKDPLKACIFSFWQDLESYQNFMEEIHDRIFIASGQKETYHSISVDLFQVEFGIPGPSSYILSTLEDCKFIRTTSSHFKEKNLHHFIEMQRNVWNSGIEKPTGLLGGEIAFSLKNKLHILVFTGWNNQTHQNYLIDVFPDLKKVASPEQDILKEEDEQFVVENSWRVNPNSN